MTEHNNKTEEYAHGEEKQADSGKYIRWLAMPVSFLGYVGTAIGATTLGEKVTEKFGEDIARHAVVEGDSFLTHFKKSLSRLADLKLWRSNATVITSVAAGFALTDFVARKVSTLGLKEWQPHPENAQTPQEVIGGSLAPVSELTPQHHIAVQDAEHQPPTAQQQAVGHG